MFTRVDKDAWIAEWIGQHRDAWWRCWHYHVEHQSFILAATYHSPFIVAAYLVIHRPEFIKSSSGITDAELVVQSLGDGKRRILLKNPDQEFCLVGESLTLWKSDAS